jgi:DNA-directed RNA polymerase specialized sigma24 family protein
LWERFFARMVEVARRRLGSLPRRVTDEEDAALSAFVRFQQAAQAGRLPRLLDRDDLWRVLFTLTLRVVSQHLREQNRLKRGGGQVRGDSALHPPEGETIDPSDPGLGPDEAAAWQDELKRLLAALDDDQLRQIALRKLEGCTNVEIARELGCAEPTVERRLRLIRCTWETMLPRREEEASAP